MRHLNPVSFALALAIAILHVAPRAQAQCGNVLLYDVSRSSRLAAGADLAGCAVREATSGDFLSLLDEGGWDIVAMDFPSTGPVGVWQRAIAGYVEGGGRLTISYWRMNDSFVFGEMLGVSVVATLATMPATYAWEEEHPILNSPVPLVLPTDWDDVWGDNGDRFDPLGETVAVAGLTELPSEGQSIVLVAHDGRVIVNGFLFDDYGPDLNGNDRADGIDFAYNQFVFLSAPSSCGDGVLTDDEVCDEGAANGAFPCGCQSTCRFASTGSACGFGGACTEDDTCNGLGECLEGGDVLDGTLCGGASGDPCLTAATCIDGTCVSAGFAPAGTVCADAARECHQADTCNGAGRCDDRGFSPPGLSCGSAEETPCDRADECDGTGRCDLRLQPVGTECAESDGSCRLPGTCDTIGACESVGPSPPGTPCGDLSSGPCDAPDTCSEGGACLAHGALDGTSCDNGLYCDGTERCTSGMCVAEPSPCSDGRVCDEGARECVEGGPICGDGIVEVGVECDDGNNDDGDGCSAGCTIEPGFVCASPFDRPSACGAECGDGLIRGAELCDDANDGSADGCFDCLVEEGWACTGEPSVCRESIPVVCGDGRIDVGETCDDSNTDTGDGCDQDCAVESGFSCFGEPSICSPDESPECGDGQISEGEECDDSNAADGDGCSGICVVEEGWQCSGSPSVCVPIRDPDVGGDAEMDTGDARLDVPPDAGTDTDASESDTAEDVVSSPDEGDTDPVDAGTDPVDEGPDDSSSGSPAHFRGSGTCATGGWGGGALWLVPVLGLCRRRRRATERD